MNKKIIIGVVVIVALVGGYYLYTKSDGMENDDASTTTQENTEDIATGDAKKMAFEEFLKQGGSYVCTVSQFVNGVRSAGTLYVDFGKIRGEFITEVNSAKVLGTFIMKDNTFYTWSSSAPYSGIQMAVAKDTGTSAGAGTASGFNAQEIGDYDCDPWTPEASKFALPPEVKFTKLN